MAAPSPSVLKMAEPNPTDSLWIGYHIPPETAADLALPGGQAPETLHLTLAYIGKLADLSDDAPDRARSAMEALSFAAQPIDIRLNGVARFSASDSSDGMDVLYATVDSNELCWLRQRLCEALWQVGLSPMTNHEYMPHVTLQYVPEDAAPVTVTLPNVELSLDTIAVTAGGETERYELRGLFLWSSSADGRHRLFSEIRLAAEPPDWLPLLPVPGDYKHPIYGELKLTRERLAEFAASINDSVYLPKLPINAEHADDVEGALGWIVKARQNADGSIDGRIEWTDRGQEAIRADRFLYVSPEWFDIWAGPTGDRHENVVVGAALCTKPFFKPPYLRPLAATDRLAATDPIATPLPAPTGTTPPEASMADEKQTPSPVTLTDEQARQFAEMQTKVTAIEAELVATKTAKEGSDAALKAASDHIATMQASERRNRFTDEVMGKNDANGARWFGEVAKSVGVLETLADAVGEDSDTFKDFVTQQRATAEQIRTSGLFREIGSATSGTGTGNAGEKLSALASARVAEGKAKSFGEAMAQIEREQPALFAEYREATARRI